MAILVIDSFLEELENYFFYSCIPISSFSLILGGPLFLPAGHGSDALVHVGIASMITMGEAAVANNASKTVTFYTKTQGTL